MAAANKQSRAALAAAVTRCHSPRISNIPSVVSAIVTTTARIGALRCGRKKFRTAVYATKLFQSPHATFADLAGPHNPNRSATDDRNPAAIANRAYIVNTFFTVALRSLPSTLFSATTGIVSMIPYSRSKNHSLLLHTPSFFSLPHH